MNKVRRRTFLQYHFTHWITVIVEKIQKRTYSTWHLCMFQCCALHENFHSGKTGNKYTIWFPITKMHGGKHIKLLHVIKLCTFVVGTSHVVVVHLHKRSHWCMLSHHRQASLNTACIDWPNCSSIISNLPSSTTLWHLTSAGYFFSSGGDLLENTRRVEEVGNERAISQMLWMQQRATRCNISIGAIYICMFPVRAECSFCKSSASNALCKRNKLGCHERIMIVEPRIGDGQKAKKTYWSRKMPATDTCASDGWQRIFDKEFHLFY